MDMKEQFKISRMKAFLLFFCGVIPSMIIFKKAFPASDRAVVTPTEIPKETQVLWSKYEEIFPKNFLVLEDEGNNDTTYAARFDLPKEEWENVKAGLKERAWNQVTSTMQLLPREYIGDMFSSEESARLREMWFSIHYTEFPENRMVDERVWVMQGEAEDTVFILYVISMN